MNDADSDVRLLVMIARSEATLDELVTGLLDAGVSGATVVESKGLGAILQQDMPIFAGLAALLPHATGSRVVVSVTTRRAIGALKVFVSEMAEDDRPIVVVLPIDEMFGAIIPDERAPL